MGEPTVEIRAEQPYVAIPIEVALKEFGGANALVGETFAWLGGRGIEPAGAPFFRYSMIGDMEGRFEIEVGVPVAIAVPGDGRVIAGSIPAGRYATLVHTGHPDRLVHAHAALQEWATSRRLDLQRSRQGDDEVWGGRFEFYLTDPAQQPDPEQWSTEIAYLIKGNDAAGEGMARMKLAEPESDLPSGLGNPARRGRVPPARAVGRGQRGRDPQTAWDGTEGAGTAPPRPRGQGPDLRRPLLTPPAGRPRRGRSRGGLFQWRVGPRPREPSSVRENGTNSGPGMPGFPPKLVQLRHTRSFRSSFTRGGSNR